MVLKLSIKKPENSRNEAQIFCVLNFYYKIAVGALGQWWSFAFSVDFFVLHCDGVQRYAEECKRKKIRKYIEQVSVRWTHYSALYPTYQARSLRASLLILNDEMHHLNLNTTCFTKRFTIIVKKQKKASLLRNPNVQALIFRWVYKTKLPWWF